MDNQETQNIPSFKTPPNPSSTQPIDFMKVTFFVLLGLILVIGLIFAGIEIGKKQTTNQQKETISSQVSVSPTTAPKSLPKTTGKTPGWSIYNNIINGYSIEYPSDWHFASSNPAFIGVQGEVALIPPNEESQVGVQSQVDIIVTGEKTPRYPFYTDKDFQDWLTKPVDTDTKKALYKIGNASVAGNQAVQLVQQTPPQMATEYYYSVITWFRLKNVNYYFENGSIQKSKVTSYQNQYEEMLSSFKFNDSINSTLVDWKTYTDPNGLYEFMYPQNYQLGHYSTDNSPLLLNKRIDWGVTQHPAGTCKGDCPIITKTQNIDLNTYSGTVYEGWIGSIGGETPQSFIKYEIKEPDQENYFVITLWELDRTSNNYPQDRKVGVISDSDRKVFNQILSTFKFTN